MNDYPAITLLTLTPLLGGLLVAGVPASRAALARGLALGFSLVALVQVLGLAICFDPAGAGMQFPERHPWIPTLGVDYFVGLDGLGLLMVLLAALLVPLALGLSGPIRDRVPLYHALVLWLQSGLFGTFTALNFFHWFIFWELSLIPAFFLIKFWGGGGRSAAATQFFIYTMVGSVTLLLSFLALQSATGTFDFLALAARAGAGDLAPAVGRQLEWSGLGAEALMTLLFLGALLGFAVKVPMMPFHTWLPSAYAEAPSPVTLLLTGAMSKMGLYGLVRILGPIFPEPLQAWRTPLLALAGVTVVWGAAAALAQRDLKRMLAYSSVNHLGYCLLAVFAVAGGAGEAGRLAADRVAAWNGTLLQMFNHGLTAATLFGFVALFERRSGGVRAVDQFGGLRKVAPVFTGLMGIALFSSLGLPGLNGFVGEFLIFRGVFGLAPWAAAVSVLGLLITAVFLLTVIQRVFSGPLNERWRGFADLTPGERWLMAPAIALLFLFGIYPQCLVGLFNPMVTRWVAALGGS